MSNRIILIGGFLVGETRMQYPGQFVIQAITGLEETPPIDRNMSPKLFGTGSYVSKFAKFEAREIEVQLYASIPGIQLSDFSLFRMNIGADIQARINTIFDVILIDTDDEDNELVRKVWQCTLGEDPFVWNVSGTTVKLTISLVAPDPRYNVYINGSGTPDYIGVI